MEPLKNIFSLQLIHTLGNNIQAVYPQFALNEFVAMASENLEDLEMKPRAFQIYKALQHFLPKNFEESASICIQSFGPELTQNQNNAFGLSVFYYLPFSDWISEQGIAREKLPTSFKFLSELTKRFTAEFAVRKFLMQFPTETMNFIHQCAESNNLHLRRFASEGIRPYLPWGLQLKSFAQNPQPVFEVLQKLMNDPNEYVQKSVGNNLNDITKNHPNEVIQFLQPFVQNPSKGTQKIIHLATRNLIKKGNPDVLNLLNYTTDIRCNAELKLDKAQVKMGEKIGLELNVCNLHPQTQNWIIDYCVYFNKANNKPNGKVFKWKKLNIVHNQIINLQTNYDFKAITTRKYYPGKHRIEVIINGKTVANAGFDLI